MFCCLSVSYCFLKKQKAIQEDAMAYRGFRTTDGNGLLLNKALMDNWGLQLYHLSVVEIQETQLRKTT